MAYFRKSGKKIIGYCSGGAEKELYFALGEKNFLVGLNRIVVISHLSLMFSVQLTFTLKKCSLRYLQLLRCIIRM